MANPTGQELKSKAQGTAEQLTDKAKDVSSSVASHAHDAATAARDKVGDLASAARHGAEDATSKVGSGMQSLAGSLRESGPREGMLGSAKSAVADALDHTGGYVSQEGLSGMADDLSGLIRKNPIPALLIGIGVGYLLARVTSRS
jgi:ElaB/YqjD/DUF883 family membrane-anchored ribosome-binding protein